MQGSSSTPTMCIPSTSDMESSCAARHGKDRKTPIPTDAEAWYLTPPSSTDTSLTKVRCRIRKTSDSVVVCHRGRANFDRDEVKSTIRDIFQKVDILKELYKKSMIGTVCRNILNRLSERDLLRASHVSQTWHTIIRFEDLRSGRIVSRFVRKLKAEYLLEKENRSSASTKNQGNLGAQATPLKDSSNTSREKSCAGFETPVSTPRRTRIDSKESYQQCPQCRSPAKTTKQCAFCAKCNDTFCTYCFYSNNRHSPTCHVIGGRGITCSPNKLSNSSRRYSIGSKENKARLKRI